MSDAMRLRLSQKANADAENTREQAEAAMAALLRLFNAGGASHREAVRMGVLTALLHEHRYIQSEAVWGLLDVLGEFGGADKAAYTDARNETAHKACGDLREVLKDRIYWRE